MLLEYFTFFSTISFILLAAFLRFKKSTNKAANNILCVLLLLMFLYSITIFFHYTTLTHQSYAYLKYYTPVDGIFLLLMAPCLYFYVRAMLHIPEKGWNRKLLLHVLPLLPYIMFNVYFMNHSFQQRIDWLVSDFTTGTVEMSLLNVMLYVQITGYLLASYFLANKQLKTAKTIVIENHSVNVSWIRTFLLINISFVVLSTPFCFFLANERTNIVIGQIGMLIQYLYLFFKTTLHSDAVPVMSSSIESINKTIAVKSNLAPTDEQQLKLLSYMENSKPYLDETCSIQSLSQQTDIPVYLLTNLINCKIQKSFPDFINEYRVNAAKEILLSRRSKNTTLETIAHECGFGSKSAFNRAFKKINNLTPSEFIRNQNGNFIEK